MNTQLYDMVPYCFHNINGLLNFLKKIIHITNYKFDILAIVKTIKQLGHRQTQCRKNWKSQPLTYPT